MGVVLFVSSVGRLSLLLLLDGRRCEGLVGGREEEPRRGSSNASPCGPLGSPWARLAPETSRCTLVDFTVPSPPESRKSTAARPALHSLMQVPSGFTAARTIYEIGRRDAAS